MAAIGLFLIFLGILMVKLFKNPIPTVISGKPERFPRMLWCAFTLAGIGFLAFAASMLIMVWRVMP
jgi:hypothetical protein